MTETAFTDRLAEAHARYPYRSDLRAWSNRFVASSLSLLFPHFAQDGVRIENRYDLLKVQLNEALRDLRETYPTVGLEIAESFLAALPNVYELLLEDAEAFYQNDPAAESLDEIILAYPGFYAVATHRIAHTLYELGVPLLPRLLGEHAHRQSGVDIHPGASIGRSFFLDHGTGVVIGETSTIGDRVKIYQGVTLGALHVYKRLAKVKRHPTIEDEVVIYAHATILGGDTRIGAGSVIGGNSWITESIPPHSVVSHRNTVRSTNDQTTYELHDFNI
ncbi:MAG: serine acetyltransferase [Armatimonadetes bacterium]|nr:serine acetyltransferase [Armatimonadota bacterium]